MEWRKGEAKVKVAVEERRCILWGGGSVSLTGIRQGSRGEIRGIRERRSAYGCVIDEMELVVLAFGNVWVPKFWSGNLEGYRRQGFTEFGMCGDGAAVRSETDRGVVA